MLLGRWRLWMVMVGAVSVTSGLAFGYDQGVIGGALGFMQETFDYGTVVEGIITSCVTLGALFGALVGGGLADRRSRKSALLIASGLFIVGAIAQAVAPTVALIVAGRTIIGLGVGIASVAAPMYVAESAPDETRGRFVSGYQLAITLGILLAQLFDLLLTSSGAWRVMLGLAAIPGVLLLVVTMPVPHSPRWLVSVGRVQDARASLALTRGGDDLDASVNELAAQVAGEPTSTWADLLSGGARGALKVAIGLALFQQLTGINALIYYSNDILAAAGFVTAGGQAKASLVSVGVVNVLATLIAVAFVDRLGRRPLLLAGLVGMLVGLVGLAVSYSFEVTPGDSGTIVGALSVIWMVVFIASFAFSLGPVVWILISEVFPTGVRAKGMSIATAVNWAAAFALTLAFPILMDAVGPTATFSGLAAVTAVAWWWTWRCVPETREQSLESIVAMFEEREASR